MNDYGKDVSIDITHFDREWLRQADLALEYGEGVVMARAKMDRASENENVEEAKSKFRVRQKYDGQKMPNQEMIAAEAFLDVEYTRARETYLKLKLDFELIRTAYDAIVMKKSTMENYLKGQLSGLWGEPIEPRLEGGYRKAAEENQRDQANINAREAAAKRTRSS